CGQSKPSAWREDRKSAAVRSILREKGRRYAAAVAHRAAGIAGNEALPAQDPVLIGKRQSNDLQPMLLDQRFRPRRCLVLFVIPEAVALDEAHSRRAFPC